MLWEGAWQLGPAEPWRSLKPSALPLPPLGAEEVTCRSPSEGGACGRALPASSASSELRGKRGPWLAAERDSSMPELPSGPCPDPEGPQEPPWPTRLCQSVASASSECLGVLQSLGLSCLSPRPQARGSWASLRRQTQLRHASPLPLIAGDRSRPQAQRPTSPALGDWEGRREGEQTQAGEGSVSRA